MPQRPHDDDDPPENNDQDWQRERHGPERMRWWTDIYVELGKCLAQARSNDVQMRDLRMYVREQLEVNINEDMDALRARLDRFEKGRIAIRAWAAGAAAAATALVEVLTHAPGWLKGG